MNEKHYLLKLIIKEAVKTALDKPFGKYLFGKERNKPTVQKKEPNTEEEKELAKDLFDHFHGDVEQLNPWISKLDRLEREGLYKDVLSVPSKYKYAYRVMVDIPLNTLTAILGYEPTDYEPNEVYEETEGGVFAPRSIREHYSWTVNHKTFAEMEKDWGGLLHRASNTFIVFLRAPIASNRFLLNPKETASIAQEYAYQNEVISVGEVQCDHVWYMFAKPADPGSIRQYAEAEKKLMHHVLKHGKE